MITYEEAKMKALKVDKRFNNALDYGTAWVFNIKNSKVKENINLAVIKQSGKMMQFTEFLLTRNTNASPKSIPF